jgi:hypothetical protein
LRLAIAVERKARYADFQGKRSTFSQFMRATADRLVRRFPYDTIWVTVRSLFRQYPNVDVSTRISIVRRAEELIAPYRDNVDGVPNDQSLSASDAAREPSAYARSPGTAAPGSFRSSDFSSGSAVSKSAAGNKTSNRTSNKTSNSSRDSTSKSGSKPISKAPQGQAVGGKAPSSASGSATVSAPATSLAHQQAGQKLVGKHPSEIPVQFVKGVGPSWRSCSLIWVSQPLINCCARGGTSIFKIASLSKTTVGEEVSIFGTIRSVGAYQSKRGNMSILNVVISDGTGSLLVTALVVRVTNTSLSGSRANS